MSNEFEAALICVFVVVMPGLALAGQTGDVCNKEIPNSLAKVLATQFPEYRLPRLVDADPDVTVYRRANKLDPCALVATGDFDGIAKGDVAILLSHRTSKKALLVAALRRSKDWSLYPLRTWCESISSCYVETGQAGKYKMTESYDYTKGDPDSREQLVSTNQVIISGTPESTAIAYVFQKGRWQYVWISD